MKVLLYGINYAPELTGIGKFSGELGEWLALRGHELQVVTAPPYYPDWRVAPEYNSFLYCVEKIDSVKITRCPLYIPNKPGLVRRLLHLGSFALSSMPIVLAKYTWNPDVVICVAPSLFCAPAAIFLAALRGSVCIVHVQDFEVDAMLSSGLSTDGLLMKLGRIYERFALTNSSKVSTISSSMVKRAEDKGVLPRNTILFPNWSEVDRFSDVGVVDIERLRAQLRLPSDRKICLYSGNIGIKQGLESVLEVAKCFTSEAVEFVFVGQGAGLNDLKSLARKLALSNVQFLPLQPLKDLPALLALADCHLVIQKAGVASAVLPSKLTNILAVGGHPVITAEPESELGIMCQVFPGIAELVDPGKIDAMESGVRRILSKAKKNEIGQNYAKRFLDKEVILSQFEARLIRAIAK